MLSFLPPALRGALAAVEGREVGVVTRGEAAAILALRLFPPACAEGLECSRDAENLIDNNIIWNVEGRYDKNALPAEPGSSSWYKTTEPDVRNGYGIYLEGTDRLRMVNNLIGKCDKAGFFVGAAREGKLESTLQNPISVIIFR